MLTAQQWCAWKDRSSPHEYLPGRTLYVKLTSPKFTIELEIQVPVMVFFRLTDLLLPESGVTLVELFGILVEFL